MSNATIGITADITKESKRAVRGLRNLEKSYPKETRLAMIHFMKHIAKPIRTAIMTGSSPETGTMAPLSPLSAVLRPGRRLGGTLASSAKKTVVAKRLKGSDDVFVAGYVGGLEPYFNRWQDGATANPALSSPETRHWLYLRVGAARTVGNAHEYVNENLGPPPLRHIIAPVERANALEAFEYIRANIDKQIAAAAKGQNKTKRTRIK